MGEETIIICDVDITFGLSYHYINDISEYDDFLLNVNKTIRLIKGF